MDKPKEMNWGCFKGADRQVEAEMKYRFYFDIFLSSDHGSGEFLLSAKVEHATSQNAMLAGDSGQEKQRV